MKKIIEYLRQPRVWGFLLSLVVIAILSIAFFHPDATQGNVLNQGDMKQGAANGNEVKEYLEENPGATAPRWTNALFSGMPTFQISPSYPSDSLFSWITTVYGAGLPSPSNLLFMMMTGMLIMLVSMRVRWYYALIGAVAWGFSSYFIIIIGAGHIWKFVTLAYIPPTIGGIVMAYRGRWLTGSALAALFAMMQIQSNHVQMSYYFLFVVLAIVACYAIDAIHRKKYATFLRATGALAVAALLAVCANLPSLYNTYKYSKETIRGSHSELSSERSSQGDATSGLDRSYITYYSYEQAETFSLFIPNVKGGASGIHREGQTQATSILEVDGADEQAAKQLDELEQFGAQFYSQYFGGPEGTSGPVYVGVVIFALFLLGVVIVRGPMKWALLVMTLLSIFLAMGRNLQWFTDLFIDYVPMYSKFRTVESILVIAEFTIPVLAILALQKVLTPMSQKRKKTYLTATYFTFGAVALVCLIGWMAPEIFGSALTDSDEAVPQSVGMMLYNSGYPEEQIYAVMDRISIDNPNMAAFVSQVRYGMVAADCRRSLILVLLAFAALWYILSYKQKNRWLGAVIMGILIMADLYSVDKRYLNHDSFARKDPNPEATFPLSDIDKKILADTAMNFRVMNIPAFNSPAPSFYHKSIGGYHAAKLTRYQDLINRHLSNFSAGTPSEQDFRILDMLNAKYIIGPDYRLEKNPYALGNAWFVDTLLFADNADAEMAALDYINPATTAVADKRFRHALAAAGSFPTTATPGDTIFETSYAPGHLTFAARTARPRVAVFSEIYFPWGWDVTIDGQHTELARVNYLLRAVVVPPGEHKIEMTFDPQSVRTTVAIARWAVIAIYLALLAALLCPILSSGILRRKPKASR